MRIECGQCHATYNVPDEKVAGRPFKITCKRCKNIIHVQGTGENSGAKTVELSSAEVQARMTGEFAAAGANAPLAELQPTRTAWYLAFGKSKHGPLSQDDIHKLLTETRPEGDIFVWRPGFSAWKGLAEVPEFAATLKILNPDAVIQEETQAAPARMRPSFTELVAADPKSEEEPAPVATSQKLDIMELMQKSAEAPKPQEAAPRVEAPKAAAPAAAPAVKLTDYVPPKKKKFPWVTALAAAFVVLAVLGTPVYLALQRVINIPFLAALPGVGQYFTVYERDRYAELKAGLSQLIKIEEDKVAVRQAAAAEEQAAIANARAEARKEREERLRRAAEWKNRIATGGNGVGGGGSLGAMPGKGGNGGGNGSIEFDFGDGGQDLDTEGDLKVNEIDRKKVLTQGEIIGILNRNSAALSRCVADYRKLEKDGAKNGQLQVEFVVSRRGSVVRAHTVTRAFNGTYVADCIESRIMAIRFPRSGGSVTASFPFAIK